MTAATTEAPTRPASTSGTKAGRYVSWDLLRVLAILSVVVQHITYEAPQLHPEIGSQPFVWSFLVGANTMILISAYFVCVTLRKRPPLAWWWNRIARLVPTYLAAVVVTYLTLVALAPADWFVPSPHDLIGNLLLLESFATSDAPDAVHYVDPSYWTLTAQLFAFTVAALLVKRMNWSGRRALPALCWGLLAAPLVLRLWREDWTPLRVFYDGVSVDRWQLFAMGIAIWLWTKRRMTFHHLALVLSIGVFVEYYEDLQAELPTAWQSALALGVVTIVLVVTAAKPGWAGWLPGWAARSIGWLAGISYCVYLLNQEIGYLVASELSTFGADGWVRLGAVLAVATGLGWLLTRYVERPAHRALLALVPVAARLRRDMVTLALVLRLGWLAWAPGGDTAPARPASVAGRVRYELSDAALVRSYR